MSASPLLSIALVTALYVATATPILVAARVTRTAAAVASAYALVLAGTIAWYSGLFARADIERSQLAQAAKPELTEDQCKEIFRLLGQAGVIVDRSRPPTLVVAQAIWAKLPTSAQDAVVDCVERDWPEGSGPAQLEQR